MAPRSDAEVQKVDREPDSLRPAARNPPLFDAHAWLELKRQEDDIGPDLWRIGDDLYDLQDFVRRHPGGSEWIQVTKGTDITEAFEVSHVMGNDNKKKILEKYHVRSCKGQPRSTIYTFNEKDFYMTLKKRVQPILKQFGSGPTIQMLLLQDSLIVSFHLLMMGALWYQSVVMVILAGLVLGMNMSSSHNFFHAKDNFRRYYFDCGMLSSHDWRITHAISHHLFTNTFHDYEAAALFPYLDIYPNPNKNWFHRIFGPIYYHLVMFFGVCVISYGQTMASIVLEPKKFRPEILTPVFQLLLFHLFSDWSFKHVIWMWLLMHCVAGYWFAFTSVTTTHHHPSVYHAWDYPIQSTDWGLHQVDAVRDVKSTNIVLMATTFKNHTLHHLFPTVDHSKLHHLYPALEQTCRDFGIDFHFDNLAHLISGFHTQLKRTTPLTYEDRLQLRARTKQKVN